MQKFCPSSYPIILLILQSWETNSSPSDFDVCELTLATQSHDFLVNLSPWFLFCFFFLIIHIPG